MPRPSKKVLSDQSIEACRQALDALIQEFIDGDITIDELENSFKEEMKAEYIRQYLLGIGGLSNMTPDDWATVASDLEKQYKFAEGFIAELDDASQQEDDGAAVGALLWRVGLYAVSAATIFEIANGLFHLGQGDTEEAWFLEPGLEHCNDCLDLQSLGWVPIGTLPEPGDGTTVCKNNCGCYKEYR